MSSHPQSRRRAFSPEQWARVNKAVTSADLAEGGKLNPAQGKLRSGITVERKKVLGILEENADGSVSLASFEQTAKAEPEVTETAKAVETTDESATWLCPIVKAEEAVDPTGANDQRLVTSVVLAPETVDLQGDIYSAEVIMEAAHNYLREYNQQTVVGYMHNDMTKSLDLVESWIAPCDLEIDGTKVAKGTWVMTVHVVDKKIWDQVKKGEIRGFSIGGVAKVQRL